MKKIFLLTLFIVFYLGLFSLSANAHPSKTHKPRVCIPPEERTKGQLQADKLPNYFFSSTK